ncbi:MAG: hypothetical protein QNJ63_05610 [Calothrix sp. MO_192.B10]|nr:hypothetical protein [Calothrix sp. MO_192.B10]
MPKIDKEKMFDYTLETLNNGLIHKYSIIQNKQPLCYADVLNLWQRDEDFRCFFISLLSDVSFSAYRWETPPITNDTAKCQFEFVILNCPGIARTPDSKTYANYFTTSDLDDGIVVFENLGKDAVLVVPSPRGSESAYGHLATFIRHAPDSQKHTLWRIVGQTMEKQISDRPIWLSTAGGGVSWLHVRLDSRPKYYGFQPYKNHYY